MAGAGYKLFNTGDVLTAAQVNTYLQEQTVMVFADATARTTALSGVLAEGMVTYLKDTNAIEKYTGAAWVNIDSGSTSPLTTKGDLYTYSTADARLAVGNNGETLVADSSATTGLRWQGNFAAGKNKIINGDFNINQRAFTSSTSVGLLFDRWNSSIVGGTCTQTAQTFTLGTAPVAGYEGKNFFQVAVSGQSAAGDLYVFTQKIESVRTFANQAVTISFWAKASSGTPAIAVEMAQNFGSGGSPSAQVNTGTTKQTISTSWARYTYSITVPSISGKTIGTNNDDYLALNVWLSGGSTYNSRTDTLGVQNSTFQLWGFQVEAGSVATAFQTATGTFAGELAACQRYYFRQTGSTYTRYGAGTAASTTSIAMNVVHPVPMRVTPTAIEFANLAVEDGVNVLAVTAISGSSVASSNTLTAMSCTVTGATQYRPYFLENNNNTAGYFGLTAEF